MRERDHMKETRRQALERLLRGGPCRLEDLARLVRAPLPSVAEDLAHVVRSLRGRGRLVVTPARCRACDFTFRDRTRFTTPSRCPRCRSENIEDAEFAIADP